MSAKVTIELDTDALRLLICNHLSDKLKEVILMEDVDIQVKDSMNYKAEWETGQFRARISKFI